jgi:hypothetical protein
LRFLCLLSTAYCLLLCGCVEQTMSIDSNPPGALVYLNDQEVGRTPMTRDFKWYGDYDVQVRMEGYETLQTHQKVTAPLWNWVPFDLFAALLPFTFKDNREYSYALTPLNEARNEPGGLVNRAETMRGQLEGSVFTREATTRPAPATKPTTRPATGG